MLIVRASQHLCSLFFLLMIVGCSSSAYNKKIQALSDDLPQQQLLDVPFNAQQQYQCGPAALSSLFQYRGLDITAEHLKDQVYIPDKKGSIQLEMKAAVRRAGWLPYQLTGDIHNLLREIEAGNPVLVFQNLGVSFAPQYHYAVAIGFDVQQQELILHSGTHKNYRLAMKTFMRTWQRSDYWALVAVPPKLMPATASERNYLQAASDMESIGALTVANTAYQQALQRWPDNQVAMMGRANIAYAQGRYAVSAAGFKQLLLQDKRYANGWNNLAYALLAMHCDTQALAAVVQANKLTENNAFEDSVLQIRADIDAKDKSAAPSSLAVCQAFTRQSLSEQGLDAGWQPVTR